MTESVSGAFGTGYPLPSPGLYDPRTEHESCGVAFVATLRGTPGRDIVDAGLSALLNLDHRGAFGADLSSGDGAGITTQIPDAFLRDVIDRELPPAGHYAIGLAFLPRDPGAATASAEAIEALAREENLAVLAWREVPITPGILGAASAASMPTLRQLVVADLAGTAHGISLDRRAYRLRKRVESTLGVFFASLSSRTMTYKGMLTTSQLEPFFGDLSDPRYASEIALVHARFSTNTFPSWALAQPMRYVAHNGEFTSVRGNRDWMRGREGSLVPRHLGTVDGLLPVCTPGGSDTMSFDEVLELLHLDGRTLTHAVAMMLPEAWETDAAMAPDRRAFYEYHSGVMEPWDGPATLNFTDGTVIGAVLDRNALRPSRFWVTEDGMVVLASETGVLDIDPATVVRKGRLEPGQMFLVDTRQGRIVEDGEVKSYLAAQKPYGRWVAQRSAALTARDPDDDVAAGLSAVDAGRVDTDAPGTVALFDRFRPLFAQGTTPPLEVPDADIAACLRSTLGPEANVLDESAEHARKLVLGSPVLTCGHVASILDADGTRTAAHALSAERVDTVFRSAGGSGLADAIAWVCAEVVTRTEAGTDVVVLSDRIASRDHESDLTPIPSVLALSAVHRDLIARGVRSRVSLVVEAGDVRQGHDVALLLALGADAVNPYRALTMGARAADAGMSGGEGGSSARAEVLGRDVAALMLAFGTSTVRAYRGALGFEAFGLNQDVLDTYFAGVFGRAGRVGLDQIAADATVRPHARMTDEGDVNGRADNARAERDSVSDSDSDRVSRVNAALEPEPGSGERASDLFGFVSGREPIGLEHVESVESIVAAFFAPRSSAAGEVAVVGADRAGVDAAYLSQAKEILLRLGRPLRPGLAQAGPSPQYDMASLEDLAQSVHDVKNANPHARILVEVDAQYGIGTIAVGATKAHADVVVVTDQGNAGPQLSGVGLGGMWDAGLAEAQQTLVLNDMRDRISVRIDADLVSGRDVVVASLVGADEFGFRRLPTGANGPMAAEEFLTGVANQVREVLAGMGFARLADATGQAQVLRSTPASDNADGRDLDRLSLRPIAEQGGPVRVMRGQDHGLDRALDQELIARSACALENGTPVAIDVPVRNVNRSVGTLLGHEIVSRVGGEGLAQDAITLTLTGSAGQSLGAFIPPGITVRLFGDANDFVGKGLSGGRVIIRPDRAAVLTGPANVIAGNCVGYGATRGEIFLRGIAGDRFGAQNMGATLIAEGIGDHGAHAMSGGVVLVLGPVGRHLARDLRGGAVFVLDLHPRAATREATRRDVVVGPLTADDVDLVARLVQRHYDKTSSTLAAELLERPEDMAARFTKISSIRSTRNGGLPAHRALLS